MDLRIFVFLILGTITSEIPAIAKLGKAEFMKAAKAKGDTTENMPAEGSINVLQFPTFTDFWAAWDLTDRPRKVALLMDDFQVEYYPYVKPLIPQVQQLQAAFRAANMPIVWSVWWRFGPDDGYFNTMDRFYGPIGVNTPLNALYNHDRKHGGDIVEGLGPINDEEAKRVLQKPYSLDMFDEYSHWRVDAGQGSLDEELQKLGVDTVVIVGAWTDDCIIATAFTAFKLQYDVVVISDGVSTASKNHFAAMDVMKGACCKIVDTATFVDYLTAGLPVEEKLFTQSDSPKSEQKMQFPASFQQFQSMQSLRPESEFATEVVKALNTFFVAFLGFTVGFLMKGRWKGRANGERDPLLKYS